jgi:AraC family transcriptional regulator of adaptative response / DNA-3-methyladenine glycosylase II
VEIVENEKYLRTIEIDGKVGSIEVIHLREQDSLGLRIRFADVRSFPAIVARVRRLFDLGADIETIGQHLSADPFLAPLVARRPGLRAPGGWDGFELAVRAILGQQITVAGARQLAGQLVSIHGVRVPVVKAEHVGLTHVFPTAKAIASAATLGLAMPKARQEALRALAEAAVADPHLFRPFGSIEQSVERLRCIRGVGEWTAQYIALRAIREADAFPATDIGLLRGIATLDGASPTSAALLERAESWRPWRAYAAQHLWAADSKTISPKLRV